MNNNGITFLLFTHRKKSRTSLLFFLCFFLCHFSFAQIHIDTTKSVEFLIDTVLEGNGARIGNIKFIGNPKGMAYVQFTKNVIGIDQGILISTGNAAQAEGPNKSPQTSGVTSDMSEKSYQDAYLSDEAGGTTYDVMILEFDFVPYNNKVSFNYCFASEEYIEYVDTQFNDVFAFLLSSNHLPWPVNIAKVPGTNDIVSINTINHKKNNRYYVNNTLFDQGAPAQVFYKVDKKTRKTYIDSIAYPPYSKPRVKLDLYNALEYDGLTTLLPAEYYVIPYKKYHLRIALADVGDPSLDCAVFLQGNSFSSLKDTTQPGYIPYEEVVDTWKADSILGLTKGERPADAIPIVKDSVPTIQYYSIYAVEALYFESDQYNLTPESILNLDRLADVLRKNKNLRYRLEGHADSSGDHDHNTWLSEKRVMAVYNYLIQKGVLPQQISTHFYSDTIPVRDNTTPEGRHLNRRVEVKVDQP